MMGQRRILVVDDEEDMRKVIAARLQANNYEVITAADGEKGWEEIVRKKPDLVLLDITMPKINGWKVLEKIRANEATKRLPVIMMTGKGETDSVLASKKHQATDYFVKPFETEELLEYIRRYI